MTASPSSDIILSYRSPLAGVAKYEAFSAGDVWTVNSSTTSSLENLEDERRSRHPSRSHGPAWVSITLDADGRYPGYLVHHVRGYKVLGGVDELPGPLLEWTHNVRAKILEEPVLYSCILRAKRDHRARL